MTKSNQSTERGYAITRGTGRTADDRVEELQFDDTTPARAGEPLPADERRTELPPGRARKGGVNGAESTLYRKTGENVTDDDLSPETLFHQQAGSLPNDQALEISDIDEIGAGFGLDEAELARKEHPDTVPDVEATQRATGRNKKH